MLNKNILVADDDPHVQELTKLFLEQAGYFVKVCGDGFTAVEEVNSNPYGLVILDLVMPHMNGLAALKKISKKISDGTCSVLVLTNSKDSQDVIEAKSLGAQDYLIKPPGREDLLRRVERILGTKPQFHQVYLDDVNADDTATFPIQIKIVSVSSKGMLIEVPIKLPNDHLIEHFSSTLFQNLGIKKTSFKATECNFKEDDSNFFYFLSFVGMEQDDQEKMKDWIMNSSFAKKKTG